MKRRYNFYFRAQKPTTTPKTQQAKHAPFGSCVRDTRRALGTLPPANTFGQFSAQCNKNSCHRTRTAAATTQLKHNPSTVRMKQSNQTEITTTRKHHFSSEKKTNDRPRNKTKHSKIGFTPTRILRMCRFFVLLHPPFLKTFFLHNRKIALLLRVQRVLQILSFAPTSLPFIPGLPPVAHTFYRRMRACVGVPFGACGMCVLFVSLCSLVFFFLRPPKHTDSFFQFLPGTLHKVS